MRYLSILIAVCIGVPSWRAAAAERDALVEAGIPATSRAWAGADYKRVAEILAAGKVPLPRLTSEEGRKFFQRLTSTDNLSVFRNRSLPIGTRLQGYVDMVSSASAIIEQYLAAANRDAQVYREVALQSAFLLRIAAVGVELTDEFIPTIAKDEDYPARMAGLKRMRGGLTTMFSGAETSLSETSAYTSKDLSLLLDAMAETLPTVKKAFEPDYKLELRKKLETRRAQFRAPEDAQKIQRMIDELGK